jgi:hypothetical protein
MTFSRIHYNQSCMYTTSPSCDLGLPGDLACTKLTCNLVVVIVRLSWWGELWCFKLLLQSSMHAHDLEFMWFRSLRWHFHTPCSLWNFCVSRHSPWGRMRRVNSYKSIMLCRIHYNQEISRRLHVHQICNARLEYGLQSGIFVSNLICYLTL